MRSLATRHRCQRSDNTSWYGWLPIRSKSLWNPRGDESAKYRKMDERPNRLARLLDGERFHLEYYSAPRHHCARSTSLRGQCSRHPNDGLSKFHSGSCTSSIARKLSRMRITLPDRRIRLLDDSPSHQRRLGSQSVHHTLPTSETSTRQLLSP